MDTKEPPVPPIVHKLGLKKLPRGSRNLWGRASGGVAFYWRDTHWYVAFWKDGPEHVAAKDFTDELFVAWLLEGRFGPT